MALDLLEELERLLTGLDAAQLEYALCGGLAVGIHGLPRATMDIDVLVRAEDLDRARLVSETGKISLVDLHPVNSDLEPAWATRGVVDWRERRLSVLDREGMRLANKRTKHRQGIVDVMRLDELTDVDMSPRAVANRLETVRQLTASLYR